MSQLRRWIEQRLGIAPVAAGEDTQWTIRFHLGWPDWFLFLFLAFVVVYIVAVYWREGSSLSRLTRLALAGLRILAIVLLLVMLGGLELAVDRTGLPFLAVLVDDSESMSVRDALDGDATTTKTKPAGGVTPASPGDAAAGADDGGQPPTRSARAAKWLAADDGAALKELLTRNRLQLYAQSSSVRLLGSAVKPGEVDGLLAALRELKPAGPESRIGDNVRDVLNQLRGTPPSAVVLITDGVVTQGETLAQAAAFAERKNIPVFAVGVGDRNPERDLRLEDLLVDDTVFVDDSVAFEATLAWHGFNREKARVTLSRRPAEPATAKFEENLDAKEVELAPGAHSVKVKLSHRPTQPGEFVYRLDVPVLDRETSRANNRLERRLRVLKEKINVLLAESYPRYEFRYLKNLLEREPTVELKTLLLDADADYVRQDRTAVAFFPTDRRDLFKFDVIILGDLAPSLFTAGQLVDLREFVRVKGGGLMFIAGKEFSPHAYRETALAELLPVEVSSSGSRGVASATTAGFQPRRTIDGRMLPALQFSTDDAENDRIWAGLHPVYWFAVCNRLKPGAQALLEAPEGAGDGAGKPLLATQYFGAGRTIFQAFDSTWRWRQYVEDLYHGRYWVQTIRLLSRSKLLGKSRSVELQTDRRQYRRGETVQVRVRFLDESMIPREGEKVRVSVDQAESAQGRLELQPTPGRRGVFEAGFATTRDGRCEFRLVNPILEGAPMAECLVTPPPGELDRVQLDEGALRELAEKSKGEYVHILEASNLWGRLPPGRPVALQTDPPFSLWNTWPVLLAFMVLLGIEWIVRKRANLA